MISKTVRTGLGSAILLLTPLWSIAQDKFIVSEKVAGLFRNCMDRQPGSPPGPARICHPDTLTEAQLQNHFGAFIDDAFSASKRVQPGLKIRDGDQIVAQQCQLSVGRALLARGLGPTQASLAWAESVVFSDRVTSPSVLFNTDPNHKPRALVVTLPSIRLCESPERTARLLAQVDEQWAQLQALSRTSAKVRSELASVLGNPATVFQFLNGPDGCPQFSAFAQSSLTTSLPNSPTVPTTPTPPTAGSLIVDAATSDIAPQVLAAQAAQDAAEEEGFKARLTALEAKGIEVDLTGISVRGARIQESELSSGDLGDLMKKTGLNSRTLANAGYAVDDLRSFKLKNHQRAHPLTSPNESYEIDARGQITRVTLREGCTRNDRNGGMNCADGNNTVGRQGSAFGIIKKSSTVLGTSPGENDINPSDSEDN
jgi:hypothetical protein